MAKVDVLVVTALKEEYEAAKLAAQSDGGQKPGVGAWEERDSDTPSPFILGSYAAEGRVFFTIALARPTRMGGTATAPIVATLVERLKPTCLAMCGVCAGNPGVAALGDVVIGELAYAYDEGKRTGEGFLPDQRQVLMNDIWVRAAQDFSTEDLPSYGEASEDDAILWLLERLSVGDDPRAHPARTRYFPRDTWRQVLEDMRDRGLVAQRPDRLSITKLGKSFVQKRRLEDLEGPDKLPFRVVTGPIASGNVVVKDGMTWDRLATQGVRSTVGLEMEAATLASAAHRLSVPRWIVAKGVMDHADPRKEDRYKPFAARASAEVLFKFLAKHLAATTPEPAEVRESRVRRVYVIGGVTGETSYPSFEGPQLAQFCTSLGEEIAKGGAELIVCSPFQDSADLHTTLGYLRANVGGVIHLQSPQHPSVARMQEELVALAGSDSSARIVKWNYPGPENDDSWAQAWLLCQLEALERADVIVSIGGKVSETASTLLHVAELRRISLVPFEFLGGASKRAFDRRDWSNLYPALNSSLLRSKFAANEVMKIADQIATSDVGRSRRLNESPSAAFISRATADREFANQLNAYLATTSCAPILGDDQVVANRMVQPVIEDALLKSDLFIVLWSKSFATSQYCHDELELALQRQHSGFLDVWLFNLDGSDVVPRGARKLPQLLTMTPNALVDAVRELLTPYVTANND